ncbi:FAD:protein FMN transferase [Thiomicrorhabdus sp. zzn3]|uniref:FAD:protein FMN transferase n=1 Tax=Thiomicrorhabdus sp. zzn3 TaxID=3039775 RepID=UPI002436B122|nr:FAD:protein FMN transferase [Thiomicrorhabdus sp. zzn3]MDG6777935.1 FAD:protein FMN transferase [Thiomicrorhabdus sp. zzn3]
MRPLLGTFVEIGFNASGDSEMDQRRIEQAFSEIENIQSQMSFHNPNSDLSRLNKTPGEWVDLPSETIHLLHLAQSLYFESNGLFNCTVGGHLVDQNILPTHFSHDYKPIGSGDDFEVNGLSARINRPILITLDGIAKGFAVDQAINYLIEEKVESGWVNAGGDLRVFGNLEMPIHQRNEHGYQSLTKLKDQALATSRANRYADPSFPGVIVNHKGQTPEAGTISVTAPSAWIADALTKVLALTPENDREAIAKKFGANYLKV